MVGAYAVPVGIPELADDVLDTVELELLEVVAVGNADEEAELPQVPGAE